MLFYVYIYFKSSLYSSTYKKHDYRHRLERIWTVFVHRCPSFLMHIIIHLTHWGRDKVDAISQMTFSSQYSWMKMLELRLKFHWSLFLRVQLTMFPALVQIMAWRPSGDKPLSEPMMVSSLTHICVTRPQWVNNIWNRKIEFWKFHWNVIQNRRK